MNLQKVIMILGITGLFILASGCNVKSEPEVRPPTAEACIKADIHFNDNYAQLHCADLYLKAAITYKATGNLKQCEMYLNKHIYYGARAVSNLNMINGLKAIEYGISYNGYYKAKQIERTIRGRKNYCKK